MDPETTQNIIKTALTQEGKPYDWGALFGFLFRRDWMENGDKWFCSELVARSCAFHDIRLVRDDSWRVTPGMLWRSPLVQPLKTLV